MRFQCTLCGRIIAVEQDAAGSQVQCALCSQLTTVPASRTAPGAVIGDFLLRGEIGQGGMGVVYYAHQLSLDRPSAVKLLSQSYASNNQFVEGFIREARAAGKLNHPNIVQAYAVGEEEGLFYFAMEHVDGKTMKEVLADEGKIPEDQAISIIQQITEALDYAWKEEELIHRDIKPDNIMLTASGRAKLADLGLAKVAGENLDPEGGEVMGTPQYISPEQLCGDPLDFRSDQYSLGATFYQFVTGRFPYTGETAQEIADKHLTGTLIPPHEIDPTLSRGVSAVIVKMMGKTPQERYQTMDQLAEDLRLIKNGGNPVHAVLATPGVQVAGDETVPLSPSQLPPKKATVPAGLQLPGQAPAPKVTAPPQAPENPGSPAGLKPPAGLRLPGQAPAQKVPEAPQAPENPAPPELPKVPEAPKAPGASALKLSIPKKEEKKAPPPEEKQEEKKEEVKEEEKKEDTSKKDKKGTSLANPLMLQRQAEQAKIRKKQLIIKLSILGAILLVLAGLGVVACMEPCKSIIMAQVKKFARDAGIELPGVELPQKSLFLQKLEPVLAKCQEEGISDSEKWTICDRFFQEGLQPETEEEEALYWELRNIFSPLDTEKYGNKQEKDNDSYFAEATKAREQEEERKRNQAIEAAKEAISKKEANEERIRKNEIAKRKKTAQNKLTAIQNKRLNELRKIRKEFFKIVYDFSIPFEDKPKQLQELIKEANKLRAVDGSDLTIKEIRQELGQRVSFLHKDFNKLMGTMYPWPGKFLRAAPMVEIMENGGPKFKKDTEVFIRNLVCHLDRVEKGIIYAKQMGTGVMRQIPMEELRRKYPSNYKRFIVKALGPEGARLQNQLLFYFFLTKNRAMLNEFTPEFPPSARALIADFVRNYMAYQKENMRDGKLARQMRNDLRGIAEYERIVNPPKPRPRPKKVVRRPPPKKAPARKAAPKKK